MLATCRILAVEGSERNRQIPPYSRDIDGEACHPGDADGAPPVDDRDLSLLLANWTGSSAVPEPATLCLLALGAAVLVRRRR